VDPGFVFEVYYLGFDADGNEDAVLVGHVFRDEQHSWEYWSMKKEWETNTRYRKPGGTPNKPGTWRSASIRLIPVSSSAYNSGNSNYKYYPTSVEREARRNEFFGAFGPGDGGRTYEHHVNP
jgi:hypothetical protein